MKKLIILGAFVLLSTTLFSCTADEYETQTKNEIKKNHNPKTPSYADGPGDGTVPPPPPPPDDH
ncbi:hypothetical protein [Flavobacterium sp. FlaQc-48]|uniref:hypothetical protein n=1 Tax=Flavobacterium sp. FlaQc-48 TaxID=3374181 RepID=UPI003757E410